MFYERPAGVSQSNWQVTKGIHVLSDQSVKRIPAQEAREPTPNERAQQVVCKLRARGAKGLIGISRSFKIMDKDGSGQLSHDEFSQAMRSYRICSDETELQSIFEIFDHDHSGQISYNEFLRTIIGEMN